MLGQPTSKPHGVAPVHAWLRRSVVVQVAPQRPAMRASSAWSHVQAPSASAETLVSQSEHLSSSAIERCGGSVREASLTVRQTSHRRAALPATTSVLRVTRVPALPISVSPCALRHAALRRRDAEHRVEPMIVVASVHARMRTAHVVQRAR